MIIHRLLSILLLGSIFFLFSQENISEFKKNWPQFRGPNSNQIPNVKHIPQEWDSDKNVKWKFKIEGRGWSSPIIWKNKVIFTTAVIDDPSQTEPEESEQGSQRNRGQENPSDKVYRLEVYCLDMNSGKVLWKQVPYKDKPSYRTHRDNTYASETAVTDGTYIYVYFGMMGLYCYDFSGNLVWKKNLGVYKMQSDWGTATSPLLFNNILYMQIDSEEASFLAALDPITGNERWRITREEGSSWSTPVIWNNRIRTELVTSGGQKARGYDPPSGNLLWELNLKGGRNISSPVFNDELLYLGNEERKGGGGFLFAVKAGASGDITPAESESTSTGIAWSQANSGLSMASPVLYQDLLYLVNRRNSYINCYYAKTGEPAYQNVKVPDAAAFWATPWVYDGKIFCLDDVGTTHVLKVGSEFKVLYTNKLNDKFWASAAIVDGTIILRGIDYLYCIQQSK
jgi:outer membrane protein assembly factor BamB